MAAGFVTLLQLKELLAERSDTADRHINPGLGLSSSTADTPASLR
jgi:hypothetical protein